MPVRLFKTPRLVQTILPGFTWQGPLNQNTVYLTFDDGPIPEVTEFVLAQLNQYGAKATFFCVGDNLRKYPELALRLVGAGHRLGNHTFNHLRGWQTSDMDYNENIKLCEVSLLNFKNQEKNKLFRPPYGSLTWAQYNLLRPDYKIIMWDVLTYDFDKTLSPAVCLQKALENTQAGSIVVFHDSRKARRNLEYVLPRYLAHLNQRGFRFEAI
jgi:peptidoglycan-N-acetylglucosamine deacetylase